MKRLNLVVIALCGLLAGFHAQAADNRNLSVSQTNNAESAKRIALVIGIIAVVVLIVRMLRAPNQPVRHAGAPARK